MFNMSFWLHIYLSPALRQDQLMWQLDGDGIKNERKYDVHLLARLSY